jgi:hypothetical protein
MLILSINLVVLLLTLLGHNIQFAEFFYHLRFWSILKCRVEEFKEFYILGHLL